MSKIFTICSLILMLSVQLLSQPKIGTVTGSIIDRTTNKPVESADVTLFRERDSSIVGGTSTGVDGKFTITDLPPGRFFMRANVVGYEFAVVSGIVITRDVQNIALDPIKLSQSTTTTEEIIVEDEKSLIEFKPDKKVFNVSKSMTSQGGTLIDLLKEVPSVNVDQDGNVSLRGSQGVKIMIDGRPFGLEGQGRNIILEQIPASDVESIELITNPSAKYEAEGTAGIINVLLKKNKPRRFGYNGSLGVNIGSGDKYNGQFNINLRKNKLSVYGNYSYNMRNFISSGYNYMNYYNNSSISNSSELDSGKMRNKSHLIKLGLDYNLDMKNLIGLSLNYRNSDGNRSNTAFNKQYDANGDLLNDYNNISYETDKGFSLDINANYMGTFGKNKSVLTAELSYSKDKDDEIEEIRDSYIFPIITTPDKRNEYSIENFDDFTSKMDYVYPISKTLKLESGYRGSYRRRDSDFKVEYFDYDLNMFITDYSQTNRFIYEDQIHAIYGIYTQQLGSFGFSVGIRAEQTFVKGKLSEGGQNFDKSYLNFFPSASLSQKLGKSSELQLSYSRRIHRPRYRELNPFTSYAGSNNYRQGNPNLNPEFSDAYEINFIKYFPWATITPGVFYRYNKDEISPSRTLLDSVTTLTMPYNLNSSKSFGGELIINSQPAKFISLNGTFSYYKTVVDGSNFQDGLTNSANSWSARAMSTITLPSDFSVQLTYFYRGKRVTAQGTMEPFQSLDAAIKKTLFDKRLSLSLRISDVLDIAKFTVQVEDKYFSEVMERRRDSRTIILNVTYDFGQMDNGKAEKKKKGSNEDNNEEEDGFDF